VGFDVTDQLLIRFSAFVRYWRKKWSEFLAMELICIVLSVKYELNLYVM
jgi:hypothetical protein